MIIGREKLEKAFTEWDRRYRESPEEFMSVVDHFLRETPYTYGKGCAAYFEKLVKEV